jgi:hypothetical protein
MVTTVFGTVYPFVELVYAFTKRSLSMVTVVDSVREPSGWNTVVVTTPTAFVTVSVYSPFASGTDVMVLETTASSFASLTVIVVDPSAFVVVSVYSPLDSSGTDTWVVETTFPSAFVTVMVELPSAIVTLSETFPFASGAFVATMYVAVYETKCSHAKDCTNAASPNPVSIPSDEIT